MGIEAVVANDGVDAGANERLRKATELYRLALQLQTIGSSTQSGELLFLSCLNNLGNAYGLLSDFRSEERVHEQLLAALMYLTTREDDEEEERRASDSRRRCETHRYVSF